MNIVLAATALFPIVPFCPLCLIINFISLTLPIAFWWVLKVPGANDQSEDGKIINWTSRFSWQAILVLTFIIGILFQIILARTGPIHSEQVKYEHVLEDFHKEPVQDFSDESLSPRLGPAEAPVQLLVFSSFQCLACKVFGYSTQYLHNKFGDKIAVTFKHFPLSTSCNTLLSNDMQPHACEAAFASMAAQQQRDFWPYHNELFASDLSSSEAILENSATAVGLDLIKWQQDRQSDQIQRQVQFDIALAYQVGVDGTPSVFLNGRRVREFQLPVLEFLVRKELERLMQK